MESRIKELEEELKTMLAERKQLIAQAEELQMRALRIDGAITELKRIKQDDGSEETST